MKDSIKIGIIGDYDGAKPSHRATADALRHSAAYLSEELTLTWLDTSSLLGQIDEKMKSFNALFCAPGGAYVSYAGAMNAVRCAREFDIPFVGTCGGFQCAVMEYARNVLGMSEAYNEELNPEAQTFVVRALSCSLAGQTAEVLLKETSVCRGIYGEERVMERFNCNYGISPDVLDAFQKTGFLTAGTDINNETRLLEIPGKRFYIAALFQPQLMSTPDRPHKLLNQYLRRASE